MKRSDDRILTTHAGSLPRPDDLVRMMWQYQEGEPVDEAALEERIRAAVPEVVEKQQAAGIDIVSDGEMSKRGFVNYVSDRLTGFGGQAAPAMMGDLADYPEVAQQVFGEGAGSHVLMCNCEGPVEARSQEAVNRDIANLTAALQGADVEEAFICATSPGCVTATSPNRYYPSYEDYLRAVTDAMKPEYHAIVDAGFILQLDCPDLPMAAHVPWEGVAELEFAKSVELHLEALNDAVAGISPEQMRLHLCWGNYPGPHHKDVPLRDVIEPVLEARPAAVYFEAANPQHEHEWDVFQELEPPAEKVLIPGVIDTKTTHIEHPRLVAQRIMRLANLVGRENLIAGTDCGFGTFVGFSAVHPDIAWAKLQSLAEGAQMASEQLW